MLFSMTSDYFKSTGDPEPYLCRIAESGFTHTHWCHHWNDDFLYSDTEITHIETAMRNSGLQLLNLHASAGVEKNPASELEHERRAGVELILNRLDMTVRLGGNVIILHAPREDSRPFRRSLEELEHAFVSHNIRLALENTGPNFPALLGYLQDYSPKFLGFCYDTGHGNLPDFQPFRPELMRINDRILAFHIHDNDGHADLHRLPFSGTTDWDEVAKLIAASACRDSINLESNMNNYEDKNEVEHLRQALATAKRLADIVKKHATPTQSPSL